MSQVMQYGQAIPALAAIVLSHINPKTAKTRLAAMNEFQQREASEKKRGNEQTIKVRKCLWLAIANQVCLP